MDLARALAATPHLHYSAPRSPSVSITSSRQPTAADPLGLQSVTEPENPTADIIFVHGLGGSAFRTWSWQKKPENFWPKWLSRDDYLVGCRILTFGYNSNFMGDARGLDIVDFAKDLLLQMLNHPGGLGNDRPILFVTHSMGGLVVKKAYTLGKHHDRFGSLVSSTTGIVFLATPHCGSHYAKTLKRILAAVSIAVAPKAYVNALETQSPAIQAINGCFGRHCDELALVSFYETLPSRVVLTKQIIVEKDSAVLGYANELSASMHADHHTISKYQNEFDPNFVKLKDTLKRLLSRPPPRGPNETSAEHLKEIQRILGVFDVAKDDLCSHDPNVSRDSGSWLASEPGFAAWLRATNSAADPRFYWLLGLPGTGKTVLSTGIIHQLQRRNQMVQYHFFCEAHQEKRAVAYALRSIATQLALSSEEFREALLALRLKTGLSFSHHQSQPENFHRIWEKIFEAIVFQLRFPHPLIWVLDGIDESDMPDTLIAHFSRIQSQTPIKVLFSSRPLKAIALFESAHISSYFLRQEDTAQDMRRYVANVVRQALPSDEHLQRDIVGQILENSSGLFLWAKLVLDALEENLHTQDDIRAALTGLPNGMVPMYKRMLGKIEGQTPRTKKMACRILTLATCSWRPLRLDELRVALEPEFGKFINLEDTIAQICGNFIAATPAQDSSGQVSLIHKTARDFLATGDPGHGAAPFVDLQDGHRRLALVCLRSQVQSGQTADTANRLLIAEEGHPLLSYAARFWSYHVSNSPLGDAELLDALKTFLSKYFLSWVEAICLSGNLIDLIRAAQCLKAYVKRHLRLRSSGSGDPLLSTKTSPEHDVEWIQSWATDIIRVMGKFGSGLISDPPSVYRQLRSFCPKNSMIGKVYGSPKSESLKVTGLKAETWDDCLASVSLGKYDYASRVMATEAYFVTLLSAKGVLVVWSAETFEQLRVIQAGGFVRRMALNKAGTAVATVGRNSYSVWELLTGERRYNCADTFDNVVLDLRFGAADYELVMAFHSNTVRRIDLRSGATIECPIPLPIDPDFSYHGCPWCMALSPDLTKIAAAWRGRPPRVWDLVAGAAHGPRKCRVSSMSDAICGPELLRWHPDSDVLFVLCQSTWVVEWRIYEDDQKEWRHLNAREMVISDDGNALLSSDSQATISVWNLPRLNLVYNLVTDGDASADLAFSPGGHRFYDVRGSVCRVWEPDALVRAEEQEMEDRSSMGGTTVLTEPTLSRFDAGGPLVTAVAPDAKDRHYCCGTEDGLVSIHDAVSGKRLRKVHRHRASSTVLGLCWSESGKYIVSCDNSALAIAKRLQLKEDGTWAVFPLFDCRLDGPFRQFLFGAGEEFLLISTASADHVWDLKAKKEIKTQQWPELVNRRWEEGTSRRWIQHPSQSDVLVWMDSNQVRCHKWPTLEAVGLAVVPGPSTSHGPSLHSQKQSRFVYWASITADRRSIIYATLPGDGMFWSESRLSRGDLHIEFVDALNLLQGVSSQPVKKSCISSVEEQVRHVLGMYKTSIVFLDQDCWICTWKPEDETGQVARHFFIPRDWANTRKSHLAAVNSRGTFFCPRYGDVAIVRNGIRI